MASGHFIEEDRDWVPQPLCGEPTVCCGQPCDIARFHGTHRCDVGTGCKK